MKLTIAWERFVKLKSYFARKIDYVNSINTADTISSRTMQTFS
jgi:hypothetical protein